MLHNVHTKTPKKQTNPHTPQNTRWNETRTQQRREGEGISQHGKRGAARPAAPEKRIGEGEPPRRGGHERAREQPLHGDGAAARGRGEARVFYGLSGSRSGVSASVSPPQREWGKAPRGEVGSGGGREAEEGVGFWEVSGREQQPEEAVMVGEATLPGASDGWAPRGHGLTVPGPWHCQAQAAFFCSEFWHLGRPIGHVISTLKPMVV